MAEDDGERRPTPLKRGSGGSSAHSGMASSPAISIPPSLSSPLLDPERHLDTILKMLERAQEELVEATDTADNAGAMSLPADATEKDILQLKEDCRTNVRKAFNRYQDLRVQARKAEQELRRARLEEPLAGQWRAEYDTLRETLRAEYVGLGPQYELLCDNVASCSMRIRQMETSGREYDSGEYAEMMKLYVTLINQLQKYTEAMKSESINKQTQEVVEQIIRICESHFGNTYPEAWRKVVIDIREAVEGAA